MGELSIGKPEEIVSTLQEDSQVRFRARGNTTRQVDFAIQCLFVGKSVKCEDHYRRGRDKDANRSLLAAIMFRMKREHPVMADKLKVDSKNFIIRWERDFDEIYREIYGGFIRY